MNTENCAKILPIATGNHGSHTLTDMSKQKLKTQKCIIISDTIGVGSLSDIYLCFFFSYLSSLQSQIFKNVLGYFANNRENTNGQIE